MLKIEKISETYVTSIDVDRLEVCLEGYKAAFRYRDDSLTPLLQKAMTNKAIFITKDHVIDWIELKKNDPKCSHVEVLRGSEGKYQSLVDLSCDIIVTANLKGTITSINEAGERISGYSKDEIVGKNFWKIGHLPVKDIPKYMKMLASAARGKLPKPFEITWYRKDGTPCVSEIRACFLKSNDKIVGFQVIIKDIAKQKRTEKELRESEEKFRNLAEQSPNMIFINKKGRVVYANEKCEEIMGYKKEEFYSPDFDFFTLIAPESLDLIKSSYGKHTKGQEVPPFEYRLVTREGKKIDAILTTKLITYEGETAILGTVIDITERKKAEEELQLNSEFLANISGGIAVVRTSDGVIVYANPRFEEMFGYGSDELFGKCASELNAPTNGENPEETYRKIKAILDNTGEWSGEIQNIKKDGTLFWCRVSVSSLKSARYGEVWVGIHEDITERKRVEEMLRSNMEKYHSLITNIPLDVWTMDSKDNPIFLNPNVEKMFGFTPKEIRQTGNSFWNKRTHPEDRERVTETYNLFFTKRKTGDIEYRVQKKDGTWIWIHDKILKVYEKDGKLCADGITWEITERKKTEKTLTAHL